MASFLDPKICSLMVHLENISRVFTDLDMVHSQQVEAEQGSEASPAFINPKHTISCYTICSKAKNYFLEAFLKNLSSQLQCPDYSSRLDLMITQIAKIILHCLIHSLELIVPSSAISSRQTIVRKNTGYLKDVRKAREKPGFLELGNTDYLQVTSSESAGAIS